MGERDTLVTPHTAPTGNLARNPGMYPDWELNWWSFGLQARAQSTEPQQPGHFLDLKSTKKIRVNRQHKTELKRLQK